MNKIVCFGELLLRMSPDAAGNWLRSNAMPVYVGGAELNVATALACWQMPVRYCTALPGHALSQQLVHHLSRKGIDTGGITYTGNRIGTYYLSQGSDLKHASVIYDRAHSSFSELRPGSIDWEAVLADAGWFHFSAITPALGGTLVDVCHEALQAAVKKGIPVSLDLNYRSRLWQWGQEPGTIMPGLAQYCDVIMGNIWSAETLLNIPVEKDIHSKNSTTAYLDHASRTADRIRKQYGRCKTVAQTFRFDNQDGIDYYAAIDTGTGQVVSPHFNSGKITDKAGSGDCFMAGLIYGLQKQHSPQDVVDFAAAAAFGKLHETGDSTGQTTEDVETILKKQVWNRHV